jgi:hypothetical protein
VIGRGTCTALGLAAACATFSAGARAQGPGPERGITAADRVAAAYDRVLDLDVAGLPAALRDTCPPAPRVACLGLDALGVWWQIQLDPADRNLDAVFAQKAAAAVTEAERFTEAQPLRAEAWFYLGAALGARAQWKVLREERLSAARDGKRIKASLEQALALDPGMHDAEFGIGIYRYYAGVAPAIFRWLRWLLLLPGGDRARGLEQIRTASRQGQLVRGEADYQIHVIDLWYENRVPEALDLVLSLQQRYPLNPLFRIAEANIRDVYIHDAAGSLRASETLLALARAGSVHRPDIAAVRARLNIARQLDRLGQRARARALVDELIAERPAAPTDALVRAKALQRALAAR